jgi:hypothetical protein
MSSDFYSVLLGNEQNLDQLNQKNGEYGSGFGRGTDPLQALASRKKSSVPAVLRPDVCIKLLSGLSYIRAFIWSTRRILLFFHLSDLKHKKVLENTSETK